MSTPAPTPAPKATAADLLARADDLMRKNRNQRADDDLPVLDMTVNVGELPNVFVPKTTDWDVVCETVYSRVMQQLDLYSEFGLKERVSRDLRPRINDWTDKFVDAVSKNIADDIRRYVAHAIDEEVAKLKAKRT